MCAIRGIDFLNYFDGATWDDNAAERAIQWTNEYKGIATIVWHWRVPSEKGGTERAFYVPSANADSTTFSITNALQEGTWEHDVIMADIAEIAKQLKKLKDADVPVLWRPLHEAEGFQSVYDVGVLFHQFPDQLRAVVFEHDQDRALIDAEPPSVDPIFTRIERVEKAVVGVKE